MFLTHCVSPQKRILKLLHQILAQNFAGLSIRCSHCESEHLCVWMCVWVYV